MKDEHELILSGTNNLNFFQELFGNSLYFPLVNILLESLVESPAKYLTAPDPYILLAASLIQALILNRWRSGWKRLPGNLIGPAIYTLIEVALDGMRFFTSFNHIAFWLFAFSFGVFQAARDYLPDLWANWLLVLEDALRGSILLVMYYVFEVKTNPQQTTSIRVFLQDSSHVFVALVAIFLGLINGFSSVAARRYLKLLGETSAKLKTYSEWLFGRDLLGQVLERPETLNLKRRARAILFMDIRGFTAWSEPRPPEDVVNMLNRYYQTSEVVLSQHRVIKFKFSADEVLAVFPEVEDALQAAVKLRIQISNLLTRHALGVGIGVHGGDVVEGMVGSKNVKFYDVIGDTVNTAKRLETAAAPGEILISDAARLALGQTFRVGDKRLIKVKGKEEPLLVYPLE
ncbi:MAG: adenylate/guanylate cyclase domain-containing protein [Anaerolineales bacterium]